MAWLVSKAMKCTSLCLVRGPAGDRDIVVLGQILKEGGRFRHKRQICDDRWIQVVFLWVLVVFFGAPCEVWPCMFGFPFRNLSFHLLMAQITNFGAFYFCRGRKERKEPMHIWHLIIHTLHVWMFLNEEWNHPTIEMEASTSTCFLGFSSSHTMIPWGQQLWCLCIGNHSAFTSCASLAAGANLQVCGWQVTCYPCPQETHVISINLEAYETTKHSQHRIGLSYRKLNQWLLVGGLLAWNPCMPWSK